jgi:hypothetical protein
MEEKMVKIRKNLKASQDRKKVMHQIKEEPIENLKWVITCF